MAINITPTSESMNQSVEPLVSGRNSELVSLQGASTAVNDQSAAYTFKTITRPAFVEGGAFYLSSISNNTAVFNSLIALGNNKVWVRVYEALP